MSSLLQTESKNFKRKNTARPTAHSTLLETYQSIVDEISENTSIDFKSFKRSIKFKNSFQSHKRTKEDLEHPTKNHKKNTNSHIFRPLFSQDEKSFSLKESSFEPSCTEINETSEEYFVIEETLKSVKTTNKDFMARRKTPRYRKNSEI